MPKYLIPFISILLAIGLSTGCGEPSTENEKEPSERHEDHPAGDANDGHQ